MLMVTKKEAEDYLSNQPLSSELPNGGVPVDLITDISARMAEFTGRSDWGESIARTEYYDGGSQYLLLDFWPVTVVTSISDDTDHVWDADTLIDATEYWNGQKDNGVVYFEFFRTVKGNQNLKVVYTGGYDGTASVPVLAKRACFLQIAYEMQRRSPGRFTQVPGRYETDEFEDFSGMSLLGESRVLLESFKRRVPFA